MREVFFEDNDPNDPDYHPSRESEDELCDSDCEGCDECMEYDVANFYDGEGEDAIISGLLTFLTNRAALLPQHVPLYKELLRNLLDEANYLYK